MNKIITNAVLIYCVLIGNSQQLHAQVPSITSIFPLNAYVGSLVNIKGNNMPYTVSVKFNATNELIISITDTQVVVMVMPGTVNCTDNRIISISGVSSIYGRQLSILKSGPPTKQPGNKLLDSTVTADPQEGSSAAISADGNTAVVGGQYADDGAGGVWIYTRTNNAWRQQDNELSGTGATGNAYQGYSAAVSADGNTIIEGGVGDNDFTRAAWIFARYKNNI